jgi:hypothetical protein
MSEARCKKSELRTRKGPTADDAKRRSESDEGSRRSPEPLGVFVASPLRRPFFLGPQDAGEVASEIPRQTPLQIAPQIGLRIATRIGRKVGFRIPARVRPRIAFRKGPHVAPQIGRRIAGKTRPQTSAITPLGITPGTVLGTVRTVVPGMSF